MEITVTRKLNIRLDTDASLNESDRRLLQARLSVAFGTGTDVVVWGNGGSGDRVVVDIATFSDNLTNAQLKRIIQSGIEGINTISVKGK